MAKAGVTLQVMPESVETDKEALREDVKKTITEIYGEVGEIREEEVPLAFGLVQLKFTFIIDEEKGTDALEEKAGEISGASNAKIVDFRRALG